MRVPGFALRSRVLPPALGNILSSGNQTLQG
jgi:hypothetical protein